MEFYKRGNWIVGTPIWVLPNQDINDRMSKMACPHPQWTEVNRQIETDPESGMKHMVVMERCSLCEGLRPRMLPEGAPEEPFDYSIPVKGPWYERLYGFGNFSILVRRYHNNPNVPPTFMVRVETQAGNVHTGMVQFQTLLFSPAAVQVMKDMERAVKLGVKRYAEYRILKEGRHTKREKDDIRNLGDSLFRVAQDIGPESFDAARSVLEGEIDQEAVEMEGYEIEAMEREVQYLKSAQKSRSKKDR